MRSRTNCSTCSIGNRTLRPMWTGVSAPVAESDGDSGVVGGECDDAREWLGVETGQESGHSDVEWVAAVVEQVSGRLPALVVVDEGTRCVPAARWQFQSCRDEMLLLRPRDE